MFVALRIRHAKRMHHIVICGLSVRMYNIFPHFPTKGTIFERKLLDTKCVFLFSPQLLSETFLILRTAVRDTMREMCIGLHEKCRYYWQVERNLTFLDRFSKKFQISYISLKSGQCEPSCSMRTDRRTDITKLKVAFRKFANASKNETVP